MKRLLVVPFLVLAMTSVAAAQQPSKPLPKKSDDCKAQRGGDASKACNLEIEGDEIGGERIGPNGDRLLGRKEATRTSLIRYRVTFVDKIAKDAQRF